MITIVSGFGRCGSSLVMQMLAAGGMPVSGEYPAFESVYGSSLLIDALTLDMMQTVDGCAVKLLDPHRGTIPKGPEYRVIWCSRDYAEQARSQCKFAHILMGVHITEKMRRGLHQSYIDDKPDAVRSLLACGTKTVLELRFKDVLKDPKSVSEILNHYCGGNLDTSAMEKAVRPRSPLCAPDMAMELEQLNERR